MTVGLLLIYDKYTQILIIILCFDANVYLQNGNCVCVVRTLSTISNIVDTMYSFQLLSIPCSDFLLDQKQWKCSDCGNKRCTVSCVDFFAAYLYLLACACVSVLLSIWSIIDNFLPDRFAHTDYRNESLLLLNKTAIFNATKHSKIVWISFLFCSEHSFMYLKCLRLHIYNALCGTNEQINHRRPPGMCVF